MGCPLPDFTSNALKVQMNQSVEVRAEYVLPSTSGIFMQCIGFQQNGMVVSSAIDLKILQVLCCCFIMLFL